ncbi:uncharacterized protein PGTG_16585 [Puccinia graminis f. sp. tritici CRL 75-36-700-3]|uniref:Amino acid permease/ SLC12A domain-containing protein n=1 Tax=Puccinia graminis f. sp. tritici (strain CRL 75-36-700-3 / race SCCL) TaxID=418459 RepID=E3L1Y4_PUCGT|nr:uncharacterized protein PGTG_16585 [Puccinia graminis f. sp. tritici CRL 75-36-700-3]EFP90559.2 hypothetical protein PGTG_16585 [Puccinia graminis f. sp. tritici CRL 75-36-700-3]
MAIGGTLGTGLFSGSGEALRDGGPIGLILGHIVMGLIVYSMIAALGEMVIVFPVKDPLIEYPARFVDPALAFAFGWNYWYALWVFLYARCFINSSHCRYSFAITLTTEITAAGMMGTSFFPTGFRYIGFRRQYSCQPLSRQVVYKTATKIATVAGAILLGIVYISGGFPKQDRIGFRYWIDPGPFNQFDDIPGSQGRFLAFWSVLGHVAFSHQGTEIIVLAAIETENLRKKIPKAIQAVIYRISIFYVGSMTVAGLLVAHNYELLGAAGAGAAAFSPFIIAFRSINGDGVAVVVTLGSFIIISLIPALSSHLYAGSEVLFSLYSYENENGPLAPRCFSRRARNGALFVGIGITAVFGLLAYISTKGSLERANEVYEDFSRMSSISVLMTWWSILLTYIRFYHGVSKKVGIDRNMFVYKAPYQPWLSCFGFAMITLVVIFNGFEVFLRGEWSTSKFISAYISLLIFTLCFIWWKISQRTRFVKLDQMDFETGRSELNPLHGVVEEEKNVNSVGKSNNFLQWAREARKSGASGWWTVGTRSKTGPRKSQQATPPSQLDEIPLQTHDASSSTLRPPTDCPAHLRPL